MIRVRRLVPADLEALQQLLKNAGIPMDKAMSLLMDFMICESDERIIGFGCLKAEDDIGYLDWIYIDEAHRRGKMGSTIVKALLNAADLKGVKDIYTALCCDTASGCDGFLRSLRFRPHSPAGPALAERFAEIFGSRLDAFYHVPLLDYFKSCC